MQIDRIALAVRPRNAWEAMDLGFLMVRTWYKAVYGAWLAVYLPLIAVITVIFAELNHPWIALLIIWWVKPLLERVPLYVLSRVVFGATPSVAQTLRALPTLLATAPLWRLLFTRLSPTRSFCLPVVLLEGVTGKARRARYQVLLKGAYSGAVWLTIVCANLEMVLAGGSYWLIELFVPRTVELQTTARALFNGGFSNGYVWTFYAASIFAYLIIGPLYVAGGFSLYLNRRTLLEGWDIELGFRRIAERLGQQKEYARAAVAVLFALSLIVGNTNDAYAAVPSTSVAKQRIDAIMQRPEFSTKETVETWHYLGKEDEKKEVVPNRALYEFLSKLGRGLALLAKGLLYLALFAAIVWLLINRERWLNWMRGIKPAPKYQAPTQLFGLDIRPESLPENLAEAALQLWQIGDTRAALSLLYRGALSHLATRGGITFKASDTEGDCLHVAAQNLEPLKSGYFARLTAAWQLAAYADRAPQGAEGEALCRDFPGHFGSVK
jgi:hypothetical protein